MGGSLVTSLKRQALAAVQGRTELRQVDKRLKVCVLRGQADAGGQFQTIKA